MGVVVSTIIIVTVSTAIVVVVIHSCVVVVVVTTVVVVVTTNVMVVQVCAIKWYIDMVKSAVVVVEKLVLSSSDSRDLRCRGSHGQRQRGSRWLFGCGQHRQPGSKTVLCRMILGWLGLG